jgi:predicted acylesterase/phospholipase RssA
MNQPVQAEKFQQDVFPSELSEIANRRANCTDNQPGAPLQNSFTTENNLVGLACSGGGIRSASFCLGVIQHLICHQLFSKIDYLSTVSGGGYIGSCISALAKEDADNLKLLTDKMVARSRMRSTTFATTANTCVQAGLCVGLEFLFCLSRG